MSLNKKQLNFFLNSVKNKLHKDRVSFVFPVLTNEQVDIALNAMYKSGYEWLYKSAEKYDMREEMKKALSHFGNVRIRLRGDSERNNVIISYHPFYNYSVMISDLEFKEAIEFLVELKKGYKEIERGSNEF